MPLTANESAFVRKLTEGIKTLEKKVSLSKLSIERPSLRVKRVIPYMEGVNIEIKEDENITHVGYITILPNATFLANGVHFAFKYTNNDSYENRNFKPISSVNGPMGAAAMDYITGTVDFYWSYYVSGSSRKRQNVPVPSSIVDRAQDGNGFWETAVQDVFAPNSTVRIEIKFRTKEHTGVLFCGFSGSYVFE